MACFSRGKCWISRYAATKCNVLHSHEMQGTVEEVDDTNYDWFARQMNQFAGPNVYKMPVDLAGNGK